MYDIKKLNYKGKPVRVVQIDGERWWSLSDVCYRILHYSSYHNIANRHLKPEESKTLFLDNVIGLNRRRLRFVNDEGLRKLLSYAIKPEVESFKHWLETEHGFKFCEKKFSASVLLDDKTARTQIKKAPSAEASLQKAQMLIRIAEHKAVPHGEQLRLLSLAVEELTGTGLKLDKLVSTKYLQSAFDPEIMKLPEALGFAYKKKTLKIAKQTFTFYPVCYLAERMDMSVDNRIQQICR